jgi:hypothetical protein
MEEVYDLGSKADDALAVKKYWNTLSCNILEILEITTFTLKNTLNRNMIIY